MDDNMHVFEANYNDIKTITYFKNIFIKISGDLASDNPVHIITDTRITYNVKLYT